MVDEVKNAPNPAPEPVKVAPVAPPVVVEPVVEAEPAVIPKATKDRLAMLEDRVAELERTAGIPSPVAAE